MNKAPTVRPAVLALSCAALLGGTLLGGALAITPATPPKTVPIPREKVTLTCQDSYFKTARVNYLLTDETYPTCTLRLPLALRQRWPGARTFYVIPRVTASLYAKDSKGNGRWLPLTPLVNPGADPMHRAVSARAYEAVTLTGPLGTLGEQAGTLRPDLISAGGKLTVCAAPLRPGQTPCTTFDLTARYKVYLRQ